MSRSARNQFTGRVLSSGKDAVKGIVKIEVAKNIIVPATIDALNLVEGGAATHVLIGTS